MADARLPERKDFNSHLQSRYHRIAEHLHEGIKSLVRPVSSHPEIAQKYNINKYLCLNLEQDPVEVWIYNANSKPFPILEDQAVKCAESIFEAAKIIFSQEKRDDQISMLKKVMHQFDLRVVELYKQPISKKNFSEQRDEINNIIHAVLNDIAYVWGYSHSEEDQAKLTSDSYKGFYNSLWEAIEIVKPQYKNNHILVINRHPEVMSVQYYERGSGKGIARDTQSAHKRDKVGVPNFISYGSGIIRSDNTLQIENVGFRHASLPPIDLYNNPNTHEECVSITTQNLELLKNEMANKLDHKPNEICYLINVSLLTATNDKEKQARQAAEITLAAERVRNEYFQPIMFNFGVNVLALGMIDVAGASYMPKPIRVYPATQNFENQRAFFQLQLLFQEKITSINTFLEEAFSSPEETSIIPYIKAFMRDFDEFSSFTSSFEEKIELMLEPDISAYKLACQQFDSASEQQKEIARIEMQNKEVALNNKKESFFSLGDEIYKKYKILFNESYLIQENLIKHFKLNNIHKMILPITSRIIYLLEDFLAIQKLYLNDEWYVPSNNFKLQANLIDLGVLLNELDFYIKNKSSFVATSWNCKSNNDRSAAMALILEIMQLSRTNPTLNVAAFSSGNASSLSAVSDSGGGSKFGGHFYDSGHPSPDFARLLEKTSRWSIHKLIDQYEVLASKQGLIPASPKLLPTKEFLIQKPLEVAKPVIALREFYVENVLNPIQLMKGNGALPKHQSIPFIESYILQIINKFLDGEALFDKQYLTIFIIDGYFKFIENDKNLTDPVKAKIIASLQLFLEKMYSIQNLFQSPEGPSPVPALEKQVSTYAGWKTAESNITGWGRWFSQKLKSNGLGMIDRAYLSYVKAETEAKSVADKIGLIETILGEADSWLSQNQNSKTNPVVPIVAALQCHMRKELTKDKDIGLLLNRFEGGKIDEVRSLLGRVSEQPLLPPQKSRATK